MKIKRESHGQTLHLVPTQDIAATLGQLKSPQQLTVGFALETDHEAAHATEKLRKKNLDFIVLNSLRHAGAGFRYDTNKVSILTSDGRTDYPLKLKSEVAKDIVQVICEKL